MSQHNTHWNHINMHTWEVSMSQHNTHWNHINLHTWEVSMSQHNTHWNHINAIKQVRPFMNGFTLVSK